MARTVEMRQVFIASPGDMALERIAVREEIDRFNRLNQLDLGKSYGHVGAEDVPGRMDRPQGIINEYVVQSDFMILILGSRWGSSSAVDGQYSSGTEEEFYTARECIEKADCPMTDVLILFKGVPEGQLADPGPQLQKVLDFKKMLDEDKSAFYKTFDDLQGLRQEVSLKLQEWARLPEPTAPVGEPAPTGRGSAEQDANKVPPPTSDDMSLLQIAESFEARGLIAQAEAAYAEAVVEADVEGLGQYARFLRRTGRLQRSLEINHQILARLAAQGETEKTLIQRVNVLVGIGVVERKMGDLSSSRYTLQEAVRTARGGGASTLKELAYALDNFALTEMRGGDRNEALRTLEEAGEIRDRIGDPVGRARTLTNVARLHRKAGELADARAACAAAVEDLTGTDETDALAAAYAVLGEIDEDRSDEESALRSYRAALEINETRGSPDMIALSLSQIARILINRGELVAAERAAKRSLRENERTSNREGTISASHLLGRIYGLTGREGLSMKMLEDAAEAYVEIGNPTGEAWAWTHLAEVQERRGIESSAHASRERARFAAASVGGALVESVIGSSPGSASSQAETAT